MRYLKYLILLNIILLLYSCSTIKEGFTNQKKNSSDEFLVEKKSPLVMPPDYNQLPEPENDNSEKNMEENKIENLVKNNEDSLEQTPDTNQNFEQSLIEKIKKN